MPPSEPNGGQPPAAPSNLPVPTANDPAGSFVPAAPTSNNAIPDAPPPSREGSPYDFFMDTTAAKPAAGKSGFGLPGAGGPDSKLVLFAGGGLLLVIVLVVIMLAVPNKPAKAELITVNQAQVETLRLCTTAASHIKYKAIENFNGNCLLTMTSQSSSMTAYLTKAGANIKGKVLGLGYNKDADKALAAGQSSSNYDNAYKEVINAQLNRQERVIQTAYNASSTTVKEKERLKDYSDATKLLLKQLNQ